MTTNKSVIYNQNIPLDIVKKASEVHDKSKKSHRFLNLWQSHYVKLDIYKFLDCRTNKILKCMQKCLQVRKCSVCSSVLEKYMSLRRNCERCTITQISDD